MELINTPYRLGEKLKHIEKVLNLGNVNIVNMQLQEGETIAEHDVDADVFIIMKTGKVVFTVNGEEVEMSSQNILHMNPGERHRLKAIEASDLLVMQVKKG